MSRQSISDQELVEQLDRAPAQGFALLVAAYREPIYWHIRRLVVVHEDAHDASQEALIRIYKGLGSRRPEGSLRSWIYTIATGEALRLIERRKRDTASLDELVLSQPVYSPHGSEDNTDEVAILLRLQRAMLSLPHKQQLAFSLRYYDELSFEEIAQVIDSSPSSAKANYHLAKERITKYLQEND